MQNHLIHKLKSPNNEYDVQLKIATFGDRKAGITKLLQRISDNLFIDENLYRFSQNKTLFRTIEQKGYKIHLTDAMRGAESYLSCLQLYFRQFDCIIIVFDVSNVESFNYLSESFTKLNDVLPPEIPKVLVGQKIDKEKKVSEEQISELIKYLGTSYFETSAKTGQNCQELINHVIEQAINFHDLQTYKLNRKSSCF